MSLKNRENALIQAKSVSFSGKHMENEKEM